MLRALSSNNFQPGCQQTAKLQRPRVAQAADAGWGGQAAGP